ncbi:unnamed protein product [Cochlearia groenlandica]
MGPKCRCLELEERVSKSEESYIEQMMVNKALEYEKHVIEKEAEDCKRKFDKLVEIVQKLVHIGAIRYNDLVFDEDLKLGFDLANIKIPIRNETELGHNDNHQSLGSPCITTPVKDNIMRRRRDIVSKMLVFEDHVADYYESETEEFVKEDEARDTLEEINTDEKYEDEDVEGCEVSIITPPFGLKRKRVIASDDESDDIDTLRERKNDDNEDNMPISILKKRKPPNQEMSSEVLDTPIYEGNGSVRSRKQRRVSSRLKKQRVSDDISAPSEENSTKRLVGIPTTGNVDDDETDEDEEESESESESMKEFVVEDDSQDDEPMSEKSYDTSEEEETEEESGYYADIMSRLRREKKPEEKRKWEYEADMLADFGKDLELCMRAVCVLYRFQTEGEKLTSSSHVCNGRGFSRFDAIRGTRIGRFLTDGDPKGDLKKSVEELKSFEFESLEVCRALADRYSKQLFEIYNNREDPFFTLPPSP